MAKALTVKSIESLKASDKRQEIGDGGAAGLHLVVQPSGARSWSFRYRSPVDGKPKKFTIGPYPEVSLAKARIEAEELRRKVRRRADPGEEKRAARAKAADTSRDVGKLLDTFVERHVATLRPTTAKLVNQQIETEVRPAWGKRRIETITRADVEALIERLIARGATVGANRLFSLVRKFLNWCVDRRVIETSPAAGLRRPAAEAARDRVLSDGELRLLWQATKGAGPFGACVRLLLLTGQRRMEVGAMAWSELSLADDEPTWTIPASRTKNGREHSVPLSATAVHILEDLPRLAKSDLVFTTDGKVPSSGWSKSKSRLDAAMPQVAAGSTNLQPWTLHDLRRTCASGLARLRQPPHVIEALLNHKTGTVSGIAAVYNRYEYRDEKRDAVEAWEGFLLRLCEEQGANVVPLRAR